MAGSYFPRRSSAVGVSVTGIETRTRRETYVIAIVVLPLGAGIHRSDPGDGDTVFGDCREDRCILVCTSKEALLKPLRGFDDLQLICEYEPLGHDAVSVLTRS